MKEERGGRSRQRIRSSWFIRPPGSGYSTMVISTVKRTVQNISRWECKCFLLPYSSVPPSPETLIELNSSSSSSLLPQPEPPLMERGGESPENQENKTSNLWTPFSKSLISKSGRCRHVLQVAFLCTPASAGHVLPC